MIDLFGYAKLRRIEGVLPGEYIEVLDRVIERLRSDNLDEAIALAVLPDAVRGYEDLKLERIGEYREALRIAEANFGS